ncbi:hypothetical protein [Salinimonas marina]|uniref:hypothetical protein n=1 Tax=Salinimonas marina TaxID=2785918 RepID=UPI001E3EA696|nr:hypothetical protein [Salinimonas marina]
MKTPLAAFAALAFSACVCAQTAYQAPLVEQSLLLDITADKSLVMVGERAIFYFLKTVKIFSKPMYRQQPH